MLSKIRHWAVEAVEVETAMMMMMTTTMMTNPNKAGYTATSCGRVGRGGNARFPTFRLDHYGPMDGPMDGRTNGPTKALMELRVCHQ